MNRKQLGGILVLCILAGIPAVAIGAQPALPIATTTAGNGSLLANASGAWGNVAYQEPEPVVTLLRIESNQTSFPGPRSMAFGPRWIGFSASTRALLIGVTIVCIAVLAFILYRWKTRGRRKDEL